MVAEHNRAKDSVKARQQKIEGVIHSKNFVVMDSFMEPPLMPNNVNRKTTKMTIPLPNNKVTNSRSFYGGQQTMAPQPMTNHMPPHSATSSVQLRQQLHQRKVIDRQRMKMLKPLNVVKSQQKLNDNPNFCAAIIPDDNRGFATSFYDDSARNFATSPSQRIKRSPFDSSPDQSSSPSNGGGRGTHDAGGRGETRPPHDSRERHHPLNLLRVDESRLSFEVSHPRHSPHQRVALPASRSQSRGTNGMWTPPAAGSDVIMPFRFGKQDQSRAWSYRMGGDLTVSGGGYCSIPPKDVKEGIGSLSINSSLVQRIPIRDKNSSASKPRVTSSRYGYRPFDSAKSGVGDSPYAYPDPTCSGPASFQQRLNELSLLEADTVKYERSRKLKRKKTNQDSKQDS